MNKLVALLACLPVCAAAEPIFEIQHCGSLKVEQLMKDEICKNICFEIDGNRFRFDGSNCPSMPVSNTLPQRVSGSDTVSTGWRKRTSPLPVPCLEGDEIPLGQSECDNGSGIVISGPPVSEYGEEPL